MPQKIVNAYKQIELFSILTHSRSADTYIKSVINFLNVVWLRRYPHIMCIGLPGPELQNIMNRYYYFIC